MDGDVNAQMFSGRMYGQEAMANGNQMESNETQRERCLTPVHHRSTPFILVRPATRYGMVWQRARRGGGGPSYLGWAGLWMVNGVGHGSWPAFQPFVFISYNRAWFWMRRCVFLSPEPALTGRSDTPRTHLACTRSPECVCPCTLIHIVLFISNYYNMALCCRVAKTGGVMRGNCIKNACRGAGEIYLRQFE